MVIMNTKFLLGTGVLAVIAALIVVSLYTGHAASNSAGTSAGPQAPQTSTVGQTGNNSKILFANTQYAPYSYLAYPGQPSQQAKLALSGFNLTANQLLNGSAKISITIVGTTQSQSLLLMPNYKLYVIETTFGDDSLNFDSSYGDDGFVVVDPNGYIVG